MCGRYTLFLEPELLAATFKVAAPAALPPRYNIAPNQDVPVVRCCEGDHYRLDPLRWGLIPPWAKDAAIGSHTINAWCDALQEKPAFRHAVRYRRCIVPASGFFEWKHADGSMQPHYIRMKDGSPLGLAGLWESWTAPDGGTVESFAIVTTAANRLMATLHDRMPVILSPDDYDLWLNHNMHDPERLRPLFVPFPPERLTVIPVSDLVNSLAHDAPDCIAPA